MNTPKPSPAFNLKWWIILGFYLIVLAFTGITTFSVNNEYATDRPRGLFDDPSTDSRNNMRKVLSVQDIESFHLFQELLEIELFNVEEVNDLSAQSFTIVLGALLGFLAATANTLSKDRKHPPQFNKSSDTEPVEDTSSNDEDPDTDVSLTRNPDAPNTPPS